MEPDDRYPMFTGPVRDVPLGHLNWVVRAQWDPAPQAERDREYRVRSTGFRLTERPQEARAVVLPELWIHRDPAAVPALAAAAEEAGVPFVVFGSRDPEPIVDIAGSTLLHAGLHRSFPRVGKAAALPVTHADRLARHGGLQIRAKQARPTVGFCGQADARGTARLGVTARRLRDVARGAGGRLDTVPLPKRNHLALRAAALRHLERDPRIDTDFVVRSQYRAGVSGPGASDHPTVDEFDRNVIGTDYTVCVRGSGNFSVRFYEALHLGRIPVLVDTDAILPFEDQIPWQDLCVIVDQAELHTLGDRLVEFHDRLDPDAFAELQRTCRRTWEEYLSIDGCYRHFADLVAGAR